MSVSKTILIGNIGNDPELKAFADGTAVCNLSLATSEKWRDKSSGESREKTEWHRVVIVGKLAEIAAQYLSKGSKVYIEGQNRTREWEKDGVKRYTTEVHVGMRGVMQMLDGKPEGGTQSRPAQSQGQQQRPQRQQQQSAQAPEYDEFDSEIPF